MLYRPFCVISTGLQKSEYRPVDLKYRPVDIHFFAKPVDVMTNSSVFFSVDISVVFIYRPVDISYRPFCVISTGFRKSEYRPVELKYRPVDVHFFAKPVDVMTTNSSVFFSVDISVVFIYRPVDMSYRPLLQYRPVLVKVIIDRSI